ncbi:O-antigen ligase family protein, partial [bacterium]|nr:O-antigen ligase family protein [bacterium]
MKTSKILSHLIEFGLLALIFYTPLARATKGWVSLTITHILILTLTCLWFLRMNQERTFKFVSTSLNFPLGLFFFFALLSTFFSVNKGASLGELYKVITFILLYFLIINNIRQAPLEAALPTRFDSSKTRREARLRPPWGDLPLTGQEYHFKAIILVVMGVGSIVAGYGVYQYFSHWPNLVEIASTFPPNPNSLAGYLLLIIPLAFALALWSSSKWLSRFAFLTASLAFVSLLATHSRGGYLAFMGSVVIFILLARKRVMEKKRRLFLLLGILFLISMSLVTIQMILKPQPLEATTPSSIFTKDKPSVPFGDGKPSSPAQVSSREASDISLGEPISTRFSTPLETDRPKAVVAVPSAGRLLTGFTPPLKEERGFTFQRTPANKF